MALLAFNYKTFDSAADLLAFVTTDATITKIVTIILEVSGRYTLFYETAA